jgi:CheY-like chemotaxis protein
MPDTDRPRDFCEILLVEDNPADANLLRQCLSEAEVVFRVNVVGDGEAALACLSRGERSAERYRPDLILLDLNLPGRDGREILEEIRSRAEWRAIPILVLTSSQAPSDVRTSYERGADRYLTKPLDLGGYDEIVRSIERFWLSRPGSGTRI